MRRPFTVTIIAVLILAQGVLLGTIGGVVLTVSLFARAGILAPEVAAVLPPELTGLRLSTELLAAAALMLGIAGIVSGISIFRLRRWAWLMAMIIQGILLATEIANYTRGSANYVNMAISMLIVLYLNQRDIQRALSAAQHRADPVSPQTALADREAADAAAAEVARSR